MSDHLPHDMHGAPTPAPLKPCDVFSEEIHLLVDRELGPAESQVVEEHLLGCARCQALASQLERMSSVLKAWDAQANDVEAPAMRLKHAVLARVSEQSARRRRDDRMVRVIHYATAAMVVLGLGLGLVLGLMTDAPQRAAPAIAVNDAPMPLDAVHPEAIVLDGGEAFEPYRAVDVLAGIEPAQLADVESPFAGHAWDRSVWKTRARDGLSLLVQRFQRMEDLERRLGAPVVFWNGPAADKRDDPLVTLSALTFLHEKGYLKRWMRSATETSPTVATTPQPVAANLDTQVTARSMLQPMPGIDRDLRALTMRPPAIRVATPKQPAPGSTARKSKKSAQRIHLLDAWALPREAYTNPRFDSGPLGSARVDPGRIKFLDPVAANANGKLDFADAGQGPNTVVVIVKNTSGPIYIPAGQFLTGGVADRVIAHPVWLPATRGEKPFLIQCRVVQNFEHGDASEAPKLQPEIAGPTIRALLAAGASPRAVKAAAGRLLAAVNGQKGTLLGDWSLYRIHAGMQVRVSATLRNVEWAEMSGFVVTDPQGRFVGSEIVRPTGHAAAELLRRLWVSYSLEAGHRVSAARWNRPHAGFSVPSEQLAQVLRRLSSHRGTFRMPAGVEQTPPARVSSLEVVAAGVQMHALEIADTPAIVSTLPSAP